MIQLLSQIGSQKIGTPRILDILAIQIVPLGVALVSAFSDVFVRVFIPDLRNRSIWSDRIDYLLIGQGILICPLSTLISILKALLVGKLFTTVPLFMMAVYLGIYVLAIAFYLRMGSDRFANVARSWITWPYKLAPLVLVTAAITVEVFSF